MKKPVPGKNKNPGRHLITAIAVAVIIFAVFYLFMAALTEMRWNKESMTGSGIPVTAESQYGGTAVLFLSSYSPSFATTGEEIAALHDVFEPYGVYIETEYMYGKTNETYQYLSEYEKVLEMRLSSGITYDGVICGDDMALKFALMYRDNLFKDMPIAFFGINDIYLARRACNIHDIAGSREPLFLDDNIQFALSLYPEATKIVAIVDSTTTGISDQIRFLQKSIDYPNLSFSVLNSSDMTQKELGDAVAALNDDTLLFYMVATNDNTGGYYTIDSQIKYLTEKARIPMFHADAGNTGVGLLSSINLNFYRAAKAAGEIILRAWDEEDIGTIELEENPDRSFIVDEQVMKQFDIPLSKIPDEALILNHEQSFWDSYHSILLPMILIFCAMAVLLLQVVMAYQNSQATAGKLDYLSHYDQLTDIRNRLAYEKDIPLYNGQNVIVVFMDLNHFKEINDTRGHKVGDIALSSFAAGIRKTFGREHCYRYGGDEFLVLLKTSDIIDDKAEVSITQGLEEKLSGCTAIELPGLDLRVTAACGYVYGFAANEQKIAAMVIQADSNVYIAKSRRDGMFIGSQFTP